MDKFKWALMSWLGVSAIELIGPAAHTCTAQNTKSSEPPKTDFIPSSRQFCRTNALNWPNEACSKRKVDKWEHADWEAEKMLSRVISRVTFNPFTFATLDRIGQCRFVMFGAGKKLINEKMRRDSIGREICEQWRS